MQAAEYYLFPTTILSISFPPPAAPDMLHVRILAAT